MTVINATKRNNFYETLAEAAQVTQALNISTPSMYSTRYKEDPRLPSSPSEYYSADWKDFGGWSAFFGRTYYETIQQASDAAIALNITTYYQYVAMHHLDPQLPPSPHSQYAKEWRPFGRAKGFLKQKTCTPISHRNVFGRFYDTLDEAAAAAQKLDVKTVGQFNKIYKRDPRLASSPPYQYPDFEEKGGWDYFLDRELVA
jgi:hypothetical protein